MKDYEKCPKCKSETVLFSDEDCQGTWGECKKCGYKWQEKDGQKIRLSFENIAELERR